MKPVCVAVVLFALGSLLGCGGREAAVKQCNDACEKSLKDAQSQCVGPGAETCKSVVKTNAAACTQSCAAVAKGKGYRISW
jgi:hypothetical protein